MNSDGTRPATAEADTARTKAPIAFFGAAPLVDNATHRRWPAIDDGVREAIARVLDRGVLSGSNAPEAVAFERRFAEFASARHALLTHSGTSALHLALAAVGVGPGDHVLVPAYSFVATPLAVLHANAIPIFVDVDEDTGLIDCAAAAAAVTSRTRAIMPVHVHGCAANMGPLLELAARQRLVVIEDAAQAHGARWRSSAVGSIGKAGAFSLQSSKNLGAGEGGVFVTNDDRIAEEANRLRNFGQNVALSDRDTYDGNRTLDTRAKLASSRIGWMYRGNELTAAVAHASLERLAERTADCQANAERLSRALAELPGVLPPTLPAKSTSVHHKFRVRLDPVAAGVSVSPRQLRDIMIQALRAEGLEVVLWQTEPLPAQPVFQKRDGFGGGYPWSTDRETPFASLYDPERFPKTQRLLDGSLLLFSQTCPLMAQTRDTVDRYAEAFARVWQHRDELAAVAARNR